MVTTYIIIVYMEVSCKNLWNRWLLMEENDPAVIECKNKLSTYTKDDWQTMAKEAVDMTEMLGELVKYNISPNSHLATLAFYEFRNHFDKWFFNINKEYLIKCAMLSKYDPGYRAFFDQFYPGLGPYMFDLITVNIKKVGL